MRWRQVYHLIANQVISVPQLEYLRESLTEALMMYSKSHQSPTSGAAAGGSSDRYKARPKRKIAIGDDSEKFIIVDADPVTYREGKKYKTSSLPVSPAIFRQILWRLSMHKLPAEEFAWLSYCYGDDMTFDHQVMLCQHIWNGLIMNLTDQAKMNKKTEKTLRAATWLAVQECKNKINRGEFKYSQKSLSELCGIKYGTWRENYAPRWSAMISVCMELDEKSLVNIDYVRKSTCRNRR